MEDRRAGLVHLVYVLYLVCLVQQEKPSALALHTLRSLAWPLEWSASSRLSSVKT